MSVKATQPGIPERKEVVNFTMPAQSPLTRSKTILGVQGRFSAVDVWVNCPASWFNDGTTAVILTLYAKNGAARVQVWRQDLSRSPALATANGGGTLSAIPITARGRWCDGYEVTIERADVSAISEAGDVYLEAWGCEATTTADVSSSPALDSAALAQLVAASAATASLDPWSPGLQVWTLLPGLVKLTGVHAQNAGTVGGYLQAHDSPVDVVIGAIPAWSYPLDTFGVSPEASRMLWNTAAAERFEQGLQFVLSSDPFTFQAPDPAFIVALRFYTVS